MPPDNAGGRWNRLVERAKELEQVAKAIVAVAAAGAVLAGLIAWLWPDGGSEPPGNRVDYPTTCDPDLWAERGGDLWADSDADCLHDVFERESAGLGAENPDTDNDGIIDSEDAGLSGRRVALSPESQYADPAVAAVLGLD